MHAKPDIERLIRDRTDALLRKAEPLCQEKGTKPPRPLLRFDLRGRAAGQAIWHRFGVPELRFNVEIARRQIDDFLHRTVAHEVAHLLTFACYGKTRPHGAEWRSVMHYLGISNAQRCHNYALPESSVRRQRQWRYECDCTQHTVSTTRHNRIQRATTAYVCRRCGAQLRAIPAASE